MQSEQYSEPGQASEGNLEIKRQLEDMASMSEFQQDTTMKMEDESGHKEPAVVYTEQPT